MSLSKVVESMEALSRRIERASEFFLCCLMGFMCTIVFIQVLSRFFLPFSMVWSAELARIMLMWVAFIGASLGLKKGSFIAVRFFVGVLPRRVGTQINIIVQVIILTFILLGLVHGGLFLEFLHKTGQISAQLKLPMYYHFGSLAVGFLFMFIHALSILARMLLDGLQAGKESNL